MQSIRTYAAKAPFLSRSEEIALGDRITAWREEGGDETHPLYESARQAIISLAESNQRYIQAITYKYYNNNHVALDELWTTGFLALTNAARNYVPSKGYFWAYAKIYVVGEIQRFVKQRTSPVSAGATTLTSKAHPSFQSAVSLEHVPEASCVDKDPGEELELLPYAIKSLPPLQQDVVKRSLGIGCDEVPLIQIAQERGVSLQAISQLRKRAFTSLRKFLENPPISILDISSEHQEEATEVQNINCLDSNQEVPLQNGSEEITYESEHQMYKRVVKIPWIFLRSFRGRIRNRLIVFSSAPNLEFKLNKRDRIKGLITLDQIYSGRKVKGDRDGPVDQFSTLHNIFSEVQE